MNFAFDAHFAAGFLVVLCAVFFAWVPLGLRVVLTALGIQLLLGLAIVLAFTASHAPLPGGTSIHAAGGVLAIAAYAAALRAAGSAGRGVPYMLSFAGLALVVATLWYGAVIATRH